MPNLVPQDMNEWMRRMESRIAELTRRNSDLIPGVIEDNVSLDSLTSSGRWYRHSTVGTTVALGYPFDGAAGVLEVYHAPPNTQRIQVFYQRTGQVWIRWMNGGVWNAWVQA